MKTFIMLALLLSFAACDKKDNAASTGAAAPTEAGAKVAHPPLVLAYDALREALAVDDLELAKAKAKDLAALAGAPAQVVAVASNFDKLPNIETARIAFGEVSRAYITHLAATPEVAKGLIAFRCPMAEAYQLWVQTGEPMRNPYMGKRMLECGSKVEMIP